MHSLAGAASLGIKRQRNQAIAATLPNNADGRPCVQWWLQGRSAKNRAARRRSPGKNRQTVKNAGAQFASDQVRLKAKLALRAKRSYRFPRIAFLGNVVGNLLVDRDIGDELSDGDPSARVGMRKEGQRFIESGCRSEAFFITLGGPLVHDNSSKTFPRRFFELQIPRLPPGSFDFFLIFCPYSLWPESPE